MELHLRSPEGPLVGTVEAHPPLEAQKKPDATAPVEAIWQEVTMRLKPLPASGRQDVYLVFKELTDKPMAGLWVTLDVDWIYFE
jgi:hypothetical protein